MHTKPVTGLVCVRSIRVCSPLCSQVFLDPDEVDFFCHYPCSVTLFGCHQLFRSDQDLLAIFQALEMAPLRQLALPGPPGTAHP